MDAVTAYFITTGRVHSGRSLESLRAQGLPRPVVEVRDIRPMRSAYATALACPTLYAFLLDDDVVLRPGVVERLVEEMRERRREQENAFWICPVTLDELSGEATGCGVHLFHVPLLRRVGFPDGPHLSFAQREAAEALGLTWLRSPLVMGIHHAGSPRDVYLRYLWLQIRAASGQRRGLDLPELLRRAVATGELLAWMACLGVLDGRSVGALSSSKDEGFVGPEGAALDLDHPDPDRVRARVTELCGGPAAGRRDR